MRRIYLVLSLLAIAGLAMPSARAQWVQTNGPWTGSYLPSVFVDGQTVLAGTQFGVYRSTDGGYNWQSPMYREPFGTVLCFAANGNVYFAGTAVEGVFRSADNGRTWSAINRGLQVEDLNVRALAVSPDGTLLFAGTSKGVYRSTDNGTSWTSSSEGMTALSVRCLLIRNDGGMMYAGTSKGLFRSTDKGISWSQVNGGIDNYVEAIAYSGNVLIAVTLKGVFRSENEGEHWTQPTLGLPETNGYDIAVSGALVFIGTPEGVFASKDNGGRWFGVNTGLPDAAVFRVFAIGTASEGTLFAGTDGGVFRADLLDMKWHSVNEGLPTVSMMALAGVGGTVYAGTHGWGVFRTDDGGGEWNEASKDLRSGYIRCLAADGEYMFAGTAAGVQRSTNRGEIWIADTGQGLLTGAQCLAVIHNEDGNARIFAGTGQGAYFTEDNGQTWQNCAIGDGILNVNALVAAKRPDGESAVFAGTPNGGMYVSTNNGDTWELMNNGLEYHNIVSLAADSLYVYAGTTNGVYRTRVNSRVFTWLHTGLEEAVVFSLLVLPENNGGSHIFSGATNGGIFYSTDFGVSWLPVGDGLQNSDIISLAYSDFYLYAGTISQGVWRRPLAEMIQLAPPPPKAYGLALHQNYPNPYSPFDGAPYTLIDYEVPETAYISIKIYNMMGEEIASVVEGTAVQGEYTAAFDASHLPSGNYIYRLVANGHVAERMMMVVR